MSPHVTDSNRPPSGTSGSHMMFGSSACSAAAASRTAELAHRGAYHMQIMRSRKVSCYCVCASSQCCVSGATTIHVRFDEEVI